MSKKFLMVVLALILCMCFFECGGKKKARKKANHESNMRVLTHIASSKRGGNRRNMIMVPAILASGLLAYSLYNRRTCE